MATTTPAVTPLTRHGSRVPTVSPRPSAPTPTASTRPAPVTPTATVRTMIVYLPDGLPREAFTAHSLDRHFGVSGTLSPRFWASPAMYPWQRAQLFGLRKGRPAYCAGGPVKLLDLTGMRHAAGVGAGIRHQLWSRVVHGTRTATPWPTFLARHLADPSKYSREAAEADFHNQPRVNAMRMHNAANYGAAQLAVEELEMFQAGPVAYQHYTEAREAHQRAIGVEGQLVGELSTIGSQLNIARQKAAGYDLKFDPPAAAAAEESGRRTQAVGAAKSQLKAAEDALAEANRAKQEAAHGQFGESGKVIRLLAEKNIPAQSLIASVRLDATYRHEWEARLTPWREALVVPRDYLAEALPLLHEHPGTILISEPDRGTPEGLVSDLPVGVVSAPSEAIAFLDALLRQRHTGEPVTHVHAVRVGLRIIGGYQAPIVGLDEVVAHWDRQVTIAEENVERRADEVEQAEKLAELAATNATRAQAAEQCASLARQQGELQQQLSNHRQQVMPPLSKAVDDLDIEQRAAESAWAQRTQLLNEANVQLSKVEAERRSVSAEIDKYKAASRPDDAVLSAWGRGVDAALRQLGWPAPNIDNEYDQLIDEANAPLASAENPNVERRSYAVLQQRAHDKLVEAIASFKVYPDSSAPPPSDVAEAASSYAASRESSGSASAGQFASTLASIMEWLDDSAERDSSAREEVDHARQTRHQTTEFVSEKCRELEQALIMTQDAIKQRASSALDRISNALNDLNRNSGGLGARLGYTLLPPDTPDKKWICQVVPRWRRNPEGPMLAYDNVTNTAQEKLFSIHLVLAALLAAPNPEGRVLILDELADSLGAEHRREVLDAIAEVAREHRITILATCQDAIMSEASPHCGQVLYFHYPSKSEALNRPTRMFGVDPLGSRVELTAEALLEGRELM